jgi:hypothetical protein
MPIAPEIVAAVAVGAVVVIGLVFNRLRSTRTRNVGRPVDGGPANLRFTCAGCSQQFTHSRRTLSAWRKGTRQFFCNACHTRRRGAQHRHSPANKRAAMSQAAGSAKPLQKSSASSPVSKPAAGKNKGAKSDGG